MCGVVLNVGLKLILMLLPTLQSCSSSRTTFPASCSRDGRTSSHSSQVPATLMSAKVKQTKKNKQKKTNKNKQTKTAQVSPAIHLLTASKRSAALLHSFLGRVALFSGPWALFSSKQYGKPGLVTKKSRYWVESLSALDGEIQSWVEIRLC